MGNQEPRVGRRWWAADRMPFWVERKLGGYGRSSGVGGGSRGAGRAWYSFPAKGISEGERGMGAPQYRSRSLGGQLGVR